MQKYNNDFFQFIYLNSPIIIEIIKPNLIEIPNIFDIYLFHNRSYYIFIYNLHFTHVVIDFTLL